MAPARCRYSLDRCFFKNGNSKKRQSREDENEREVFVFALLLLTLSSHRGQVFSVRVHWGANCKFTLAFTTCKHRSAHTGRFAGHTLLHVWLFLFVCTPQSVQQECGPCLRLRNCRLVQPMRTLSLLFPWLSATFFTFVWTSLSVRWVKTLQLTLTVASSDKTLITGQLWWTFYAQH